MEMRLWQARATKDIDFWVPAVLQHQGLVETKLHDAAKTDLRDFFAFQIGNVIKDLEGPPEGGIRLFVEAKVASRAFTKFHIDIGIGDAVILPTELIEGRDWLGFAGIPPARVAAISREQQFAEKLHAYTEPRERNSRVKDLVDMVLLMQMKTLDKDRLREAIQRTFQIRNTHEVPTALADPPTFWEERYQILAEETQIDWTLSKSIDEIRNLFYTL